MHITQCNTYSSQVSFFLEFAKLDAEGFEKPDFTLRDEHLAEICPKYLRQGEYI